MLKKIIVLILLSFPQLAIAGQRHTVELKEYKFTSALVEMTESLQQQLAERMRQQCAGSEIVKVISLSTTFTLGSNSSGSYLTAEVILLNGKLGLNFPHHPLAILKAEFLCGREPICDFCNQPLRAQEPGK